MRKAFRHVIVILLFAGLGSLPAAQAQTQDAPPTDNQSPGFVAESNRFVFFSHYWLNMHHFLHQVALAQDEERPSPVDADVKNQLSAPEKSALDAAIAFYKRNLINKDLRSSEYMQDLKGWLVRQDPTGVSSVPQAFRAHTDRLAAFDSAYRQHFWDKHQIANENIVSDNLNLIRATEDSVAERLSSLARESWPDYKIRVDVTHYGKSQDNTAFTTIFPAHVVAPSKGRTVEGGWVETLYHEAGHQLIRPRTGFVPETIGDVSEVKGTYLRSLWHAYLFYFAGATAKQVLEGEGIEKYTMYMVRENVFSRYFPSLQRYLPRYMSREATLAEVTGLIIEDFQEREDRRGSE